MTQFQSPSLPKNRRSPRELSGMAVVALCMMVTIMEGYNLIVFGSVVPLLLQDAALGVDEKTVGLIGGIVYLGALIGVFLGTSLAARFGRYQLLLASAAVFAGGSVLAALSTSAMFLGSARLITGIGVGAAITTAMTLARNHAPQNKGSLVITITMAGVPLGGTIAAVFGIYLMPLFGWRSLFWLGALLTAGVLTVLVMNRIHEPEETRHDGTPASGLRGLFGSDQRLFVILVALAAVTNMVVWLGLNVWLAEAMRGYGFDLQAALVFAFTLTGAAVLGSWFTALAGDRFGPSKIVVLCAAFTLTGLAGLLTAHDSMPLALFWVSIIGIGGHSAQNLINATASGAVPPASRGTILGITNAMAFIGSFLGPTIGGVYFATQGSNGLFGLYAVTAGVCLCICAGLLSATGRVSAGNQDKTLAQQSA